MLYINDILDPDFDWDEIEITEEDADYLMKAIDLALHRIKQKNKEKYK